MTLLMDAATGAGSFGTEHPTDPAWALTAYLSFPAGSAAPTLRTVLRAELSRLRSTLASAPHVEREAFDAAGALLAEGLARLAPHGPSGTWMGVASAERLIHDEWLSRVLPTMVAWDGHPRIAPFLASRHSAHAFVAIVDRQHALLLKIDGAAIVELDRWEVAAHPAPDAPHTSAPPRVGFHRGTAGLPGADVAARRADRAAATNVSRVRDRVLALAGPDRWVVLAGGRESVAQLRHELEGRFGARLAVAGALDPRAATHEITRAVLPVLAALQAERIEHLVDDALGRAGTRLIAVGDDAVEEALARGAVDALLLTEERLGESLPRVEAMVRDALRQHARLEFVGGEAAERLREFAGGSVALLRFALSEKKRS